MSHNVILAPSILACDFSKLEEEVLLAESSGAQFIHCDVMDGHFVPNTTFRPDIVERVSKTTSLVKDVHLMVEDVVGDIKGFAAAGADIITFHIEALKDEKEIKAAIDLIHSLGCKAGLSIKPNTPVQAYLPYLQDMQLALIMSVEPGFGGQSFMENSLDKLSWLAKQKQTHGYDYFIEVDGGINLETGKRVVDAGAEALVAGTYLFGHEDFIQRAKGLLTL